MDNGMKWKKSGEQASGIFTIKEYTTEENPDFMMLIRQLQAGSFQIQEVVSYVFEGEDPLALDARSMTDEQFLQLYPRILDSGAYGPGLAFDVVVRTEGHPVTIELTQGAPVISTNSLNKEIELDELLGDIKEDNRPEGEKAADPDEQIKYCHGSDEQTKNSCGENDMTSVKAPAGTDDLSRILQSWKMAFMAMLFSEKENCREYDMDRVIRMSLLQGLPEGIFNVPSDESVPADAAGPERRSAFVTEPDRKSAFVTGPESRSADIAGQERQLRSLWKELREEKTPEAVFCRKLEALQPELSDIPEIDSFFKSI